MKKIENLLRFLFIFGICLSSITLIVWIIFYNLDIQNRIYKEIISETFIILFFANPILLALLTLVSNKNKQQ